MDRREFLKSCGLAGYMLCAPHMSVWALNSKASVANKRLIVCFLRGAVDGLNVVVPFADNNYYQLRPTIAVARPGQDGGCLNLDGHFGVNPGLEPLMGLWAQKQLAFVHACGSPDPTRSHFDAQDFMESGIPGDKRISTGWLNRLVTAIPQANKSPVQCVSVGSVLPKIFTGPAAVATIQNTSGPSRLPIDNAAVAAAFNKMYGVAAGATDGKNTDANSTKGSSAHAQTDQKHSNISMAYEEGMAAHKEINDELSKPLTADPEQLMANHGAPLPSANRNFGSQLARIFRSDPAVQVAFIDFGGWDTHTGEGNGRGALANRLRTLAQGLADLASGLGPLFKDTNIIVMSEFGRTAKENGNGGTDHGHGNAMWLLGGSLPGGRVYGKFSSLANGELHEGRDLPTSTDFRSVIGSLISQDFELSQKQMNAVFPSFNNSARDNPLISRATL
jgi:uncharacterized protein (DUF1501 family)